VIDPRAAGTQLAVVLVTLDRESAQEHAALRERLLAAPAVQQCYDVAGEWDYVVVLVAPDMTACRELVDDLFLQQQGIKRLATLPVFDCVKLGFGTAVRRGNERY
jgi:Lrp/AsnC family transcriptional regulator, leucine-responsive regulatory protein